MCLISSQSVDCWFNFNDWNPSLGTTSPAAFSGLGTGEEDQIIQEPLSDSALNQLTNTLANSMSSQSSDHSSTEHASCDHDHHDHDHDHHSIGKVDKNGENQDPEVQGYEKWDDHFARERKRLKKKKLAAKKSNRRRDRFFKNGRRRLNRYDDDYGHRDHGHRDYDHHDHGHRDYDDDHYDDEMGMSESRRGGLRRWFGRGRRSRPSAGQGRRYVSGFNFEDDTDAGDFDDSDFPPTGLMGRLRKRLFPW